MKAIVVLWQSLFGQAPISRALPHKRPLACRFCGLAAKVASNQHGYVCLVFDTYMSRSEAADPYSAIRTACRGNGNFFRFRLMDVSPTTHLEWLIRHRDLYLTRTAAKVGVVVAVLSLIVSTAAIVLR